MSYFSVGVRYQCLHQTVRQPPVAVLLCGDGGYWKKASLRIIDFKNDNVVNLLALFCFQRSFSGELQLHKHKLKEK